MKNKISMVLIGLVILSLIFFVIQRRSTATFNAPSINNKLLVTASFYPLYFFAGEIGGDKVNVRTIVPPGVEPHEYEPTTQDIVRIQKSHIIFLNGGGLEAWAGRLKEILKDKKTILVVAGEGLLDQDPHIWLSPRLAKQEAEHIARALISADPANGPYYREQSKKLEQKLANLDTSYRQGLADCKLKNIITSHAAFGQLALAYGLRQTSIAGISPDAEPSPRDLAGVTKFIKENSIRYIFFERLVSPKLAETLAAETGAQTLVLDPIEGLSNDDMKEGKDYFKIMQENLSNLRLALVCQ